MSDNNDLPNPPAGEEWFNPYNWGLAEFGDGYLPALQSQLDQPIQVEGVEYNSGTEQAPAWQTSNFEVSPYLGAPGGVVRVPAAHYNLTPEDPDAPPDMNRILGKCKPVVDSFDWFGTPLSINKPPMGRAPNSAPRQLDLALRVLSQPGAVTDPALAEARAAFLNAVGVFHDTILRGNNDVDTLWNLLEKR